MQCRDLEQSCYHATDEGHSPNSTLIYGVGIPFEPSLRKLSSSEERVKKARETSGMAINHGIFVKD